MIICNVTFEPGCRNNWHIHHGSGQILICVGGHGWYQEMGKEPQLLKSGDVVYISPEIKHWHGAVADEAFAPVPVEGVSNVCILNFVDKMLSISVIHYLNKIILVLFKTFIGFEWF